MICIYQNVLTVIQSSIYHKSSVFICKLSSSRPKQIFVSSICQGWCHMYSESAEVYLSSIVVIKRGPKKSGSSKSIAGQCQCPCKTKLNEVCLLKIKQHRARLSQHYLRNQCELWRKHRGRHRHKQQGRLPRLSWFQL